MSDGGAILIGREAGNEGVRTHTAYYYITSLRRTAAEFRNLIRRHWSIENELHWILDAAFGEDRNKTTAGHAGRTSGWSGEWRPRC
jgi:predicted transposase YbfD/YdcC